jgi:16S rRNA (guanine(527)-N(7))-methyltransferase RsmG
LSSDARAAIEGHVRLLLAWNEAINLTAIRDPAAIAIRQVVDSLAGLEVLRSRAVDRFVDLGSGGGFPGLTLAAAVPADRALLVDSVAKKVRFLSTVIEATGLARRVAAVADRAEALAADPDDRGQWPAVTARAVAPLAGLIELGLPLLRGSGILIAWKRGDVADPAGLGGELAAARRALDAIDPAGRMDIGPALGDGRAEIADTPELAALADHRLIIVERGAGSIADTWPRDPAIRRRKPW